jgi:hypothetical protein
LLKNGGPPSILSVFLLLSTVEKLTILPTIAQNRQNAPKKDEKRRKRRLCGFFYRTAGQKSVKEVAKVPF